MDIGADLYARYLAGEKEAFAGIIKEYRDSLTYYINRTVNNLDTAEEIAADTFAELIIHPGRYRKKCSFKTYLFMVAHGKTVDFVRHQAKIRTFEYSEVPQANVSYQSFEAELMKKEDNAQIAACLEKLNPGYREILHLIYFENASYEEAGEIMHKSTRQVENMAYRARKVLKDILEEGGFTCEK